MCTNKALKIFINIRLHFFVGLWLRVEKFRTPDSILQKPALLLPLVPQNQTVNVIPGLVVWYTDCSLKHDHSEILRNFKIPRFNKSSSVAEMGDRLATIDMDRKVGRGCCFSYFCICDTPLNCYYFTHQSYPFAHLGLTSFRRITKLIIYTVSQKTSHLWLAITLTHMNGFWHFLAEMLLIKQAIKRHFTMPPQVTCASALPGKTRKHENHIFHSIGLCYTHNAPVHNLPGRKNVICDVFDSV